MYLILPVVILLAEYSLFIGKVMDMNSYLPKISYLFRCLKFLNLFLHPGSEADIEEQPTEEDYTDELEDELFYLRADIYSYGQVVAYTLTGKTPWQGRNSVSVQGIQNNLIQKDDRVEIPEELSGKLRDVIQDCRIDDPQLRPTADRLVLEYFSGKFFVLNNTFIYRAT